MSKLATRVLSSRSLQRVIVNPNRVTRRNPAWTVVGLEEMASYPAIGEHVIAVQPDDEGDFVSTGVVEQIDDEYRLAYLSVAWDAFVVQEPVQRSVTAGSRFRSFATPTSRGSSARIRVHARVAA